MTNEEIVDGLLSGDEGLRDMAIELLNSGHEAKRAINTAKTAFIYVDKGDYGALSIVRSSIEECNVV